MTRLFSFNFYALFSLLFPLTLLGQESNKYLFSNKIFNLQFLYNYHVPSGNYAKTYGKYSAIGFGGMLKTKDNWIISGEANYLFGSNIKEADLFNNLISSGGYISSTSGSPANYSVNMRGFSTYLGAGRLFAVNKRNINSGFMLKGGLGFLQHYINIVSQERNIPQLDQNYSKGYDRLSSGLSFTEFVGYCHQSQNRLINFYIGVEWMQASTTNRRKYNYDQMSYQTGSKVDFSTSFRVGWMIPIYLNTKEENEFQFK
ncbi:MAG: hypothetical protein SGJ00_11145 [bacterium]|nr:hypothetical protein [bacterium]